MRANMKKPDPKHKTAPVDQAAETLFNYAIERDELKQIVGLLPAGQEAHKVTVEYELQLLKIISVGWGVTFFMADHPRQAALSEAFWHKIQSLAQGLSSAASASVGKDLDYFEIIKSRLALYVKALQHYSDAPDTAKVIGATFAKLCGDEDDSYILLAGKRTFASATASVQNYLEALQLVE